MVAPDEPRVQGNTRERLLRAGLSLFALQGFRATTVGQIEAAVGLQPRRGALYRHFPSKQALLDESVRRHLAAVDAGRDRLLTLPTDDRPSALRALGHLVLDELGAQRHITAILERDGDRLPELRSMFRGRVSDAAYRAVADVMGRWLGERDGVDAESMAVDALGSLVNLRRSTWTFGDPPLGLDDERFIAQWADRWALILAQPPDGDDASGC